MRYDLRITYNNGREVTVPIDNDDDAATVTGVIEDTIANGNTGVKLSLPNNRTVFLLMRDISSMDIAPSNRLWDDVEIPLGDDE